MKYENKRKIKAMRLLRDGLTIEKAAEKIGVHYATVSRWKQAELKTKGYKVTTPKKIEAPYHEPIGMKWVNEKEYVAMKCLIADYFISKCVKESGPHL